MGVTPAPPGDVLGDLSFPSHKSAEIGELKNTRPTQSMDAVGGVYGLDDQGTYEENLNLSLSL